MDIFKKLFGDPTDDVLKQADLQMTRDEIAEMHQMIKQQAANEGGQYVFKAEYAAAWQAFRDAPNITNARNLIKEAPHLVEYFRRCSPGHQFYTTSRYLKERGLKG